MRIARLGLGAIAPLVLAAGCADTAPSGPDNFGYNGTGIAVGVSPLTLESLTDACYSFAVQNEAGQLVVGRGPETAGLGVAGTALNTICASQFGNSGGGDISYVAPCDASLGLDDVNGDNANTHVVTLWVDALCTVGTGTPGGTPGVNGSGGTICQEMQNYVDPCPTGCTLPVACEENADTPVSFNFTIMGQADQGFFDLAVNFDDIFCSAKADCTNTAGDDIKLLFGADGERYETVVLAFACSGGENADTHLYMDNVTVTCEDNAGVVRFITRPWEPEGNVRKAMPFPTATYGGLLLAGPASGQNNTSPLWSYSAMWETVFQTANYRGVERLGDYNKVYWNTAIGIDMPRFGSNGDGSNVCTLHTTMTASDGPLNDVLPFVPTTPASTTYPAVTFNVPLNPTGSLAKLDCGQHPLDGVNSGVQTSYSPVDAPWCFSFGTSADFVTGDTTVTNYAVDGSGFPQSYPNNCTRYGRINASVFYDINGNGVRDVGEGPSDLVYISTPGTSPPTRPDANGEVTLSAFATLNLTIPITMLTGGPLNPCPSGGAYEVTSPSGTNTYFEYVYQGQTLDLEFGYTCGTPTP